MTRGELDREAVLRIAASIKKRGPGIVRRAHFLHRGQPVGIAAAVVAAIVLATQWISETAPIAPSRIDMRACASWEDRAIEKKREDGSLELELRHALAIASDTSELRIRSLVPCSTVLRLDRGRVVVHARDLGGGELRVETGPEQVVVHGTVFAVERSGDRLDVEVAEGRVELVAKESVVITAGQRVRLENGSIERSALSFETKEAVLAVVGLSRPSEETMKTADEPPQRIERDRSRSGRKSKHRRTRAAIEKRTKSEARLPRAIDEPDREPLESRDPEETSSALMQRAQDARKRGDHDLARHLFTSAGRDLEAAWVSLCRMELDLSRPAAAISALDEHQRRFQAGALAIEAAWLRVRALDASGDREGAERAAAKLVEVWPRSPYADQARRWLEKP